jgi:hypothetical protein
MSTQMSCRSHPNVRVSDRAVSYLCPNDVMVKSKRCHGKVHLGATLMLLRVHARDTDCRPTALKVSAVVLPWA